MQAADLLGIEVHVTVLCYILAQKLLPSDLQRHSTGLQEEVEKVISYVQNGGFRSLVDKSVTE
jgi:hypothetical protein